MVFAAWISVSLGVLLFPGGLASPPRHSPRSLNHVDIDESSYQAPATDVFSLLKNTIPAPAPKSLEEAMSRLKSIKLNRNTKGYEETAKELVAHGLATNDLDALEANFTKINRVDNVNSRNPRTMIYPKKNKHDAPYSAKEAAMRRQIYIPDTFTYGEKPPMILVPGTGARGGNNFVGNFMKTLRHHPHADIVWINPPGYQLADAQLNAETVAYTINYISGISGNRNVTMLGWSQGSLSMQWALKYWPSTRSIVTGVLTLSGDYHGTIVANLLDATHALPLPPAVLQQNYNSNFIKTMRSNGGDSAYVPTTTVYSSFFDEIVEPQNGIHASSYLKDARGVGVSNHDIQKTCPRASPAGSIVSHESNLFNALAHALVEDTLKNGHPARLDRIDLEAVCRQLTAPSLSLEDVLLTEDTIPFAGSMIFLYPHKVFKEPKVKPYAL